MSDLTYYKANKEPSTREEMFLYIETLMIKKAYADASDVFADLKRIDLGETVPDVKKITVDAKKDALAQVKALLKNPLAWRMVQKHGSKTATKTPTDEAIEVFRSIKVTHAELLALTREVSVYQKALLVTHKAWDTNWVVAHTVDDMGYNYDYAGIAKSVLKHSPKMDAVLRVAEKIVDWKNDTRKNIFGNGSNLDEETLFKLVDMGFTSILVDSRITEERLIKFWDDNFVQSTKEFTGNYDDPRSNFYLAIGKNVNAPSWLLDDAVKFYGVWSLPIDVFTNPNLSAEALNVLLSKTNDKEHRLLIARHPNASMATLKKLSKSAYQPLAETALARLAEKEAERQRKQRRNF